MNSPYVGLPQRSFWRTGVAERHILNMGDIYVKKFEIRPNERIATAGSCFAQHIANRLRSHNYNVLDVEPAPPGIDTITAQRFGFNLYSARYGNVYTLRQMLQLVQECKGQRSPRDAVWKKGERYFDALRPSVEPEGLASAEFVVRHRRQHLLRMEEMLKNTSLLIFTMGLTETWEHIEDGTVYPTAPGSIAGSYDPERYRFKNLTYNENLFDFLLLRDLLRAYNPDMRFILTVSPVPLTATASNEHVLPATLYSKSVLRAVAGALAQSHDDVDYFPSYEIVAGAPARGIFYENNLRNVSAAAVDVVMKYFFDQHGKSSTSTPTTLGEESNLSAGREREKDAARALSIEKQEIYCDEELLEIFAR